MPDFLAQQLGPLPLWAWLIVIAGSLGLAYYINRQGGIGGGGESASESQTPQETVVENTSNVPGVGMGASGFTYQAPPEPEDNTENEIETNEQWAQQAIDQLIAEGYDAGLVDTAIRKYVSVQQLNTAEKEIRDMALRKLGPPPTPLPPPQDSEEGETPTGGNGDGNGGDGNGGDGNGGGNGGGGQQERVTRYVTVEPWPDQLSTLWGIAEMYYGDGAAWNHIYQANQGKIDDPDLIHPGQRFRIPDRGEPGIPDTLPQS